MQNAKMPDNGKYTSAEIQNELLNIAASQIRQRICEETNDAGFMSIMVDESKDVSRKEQMSLCIRYVSRLDFDIHEEFLFLQYLTDLDATSLCTKITGFD